MRDENEKKKLNAFYFKYASHFYSIGFEFNVIWIQFIFQLNIFELNSNSSCMQWHSIFLFEWSLISNITMTN